MKFYLNSEKNGIYLKLTQMGIEKCEYIQFLSKQIQTMNYLLFAHLKCLCRVAINSIRMTPTLTLYDFYN